MWSRHVVPTPATRPTRQNKTFMPSPRCFNPASAPSWGFGTGRWTGTEAGVGWEQLATRQCWIKRSHKQRRVPVWFDDVPDGQANASCSNPPDVRFSADRSRLSTPRPQSQCGAMRQGIGFGAGGAAGGFHALVGAAQERVRRGRRPISLLLVGDSVDRKMWEALNNSRAAAKLHEVGVCVVWTPQMHSPELALSWLSDPAMVSRYGAPLAARELRALWDRGVFTSFAHLDKAHDELANHAAVLQAAGRRGVPNSWSAAARVINWPHNTSAPNHTQPIPRWKILHGRADVCRRAGPPSAIVLHAAYHVLWSYLRFSHRFPLSKANPAIRAQLGPKRFPYFGNRTLPSVVIDRLTTNFQTYARHLRSAFPEARLVALRTAQSLDYVPFTRSRKYAGDWEATPRVNTYIRQLNAGIRAAAAGEGLPVFDMEQMLERYSANPSTYLEEDNLHPSPAMGVEVLRVMLSTISAALECQPCDSEPSDRQR